MSEITSFQKKEELISSRQIAKATGKRHAHVLRDISQLIEKKAIDLIDNENPNLGYDTTAEPICIRAAYKSGAVKYLEYLLNEYAANVLASSYDPVIARKLIKLIHHLRHELKQPGITPSTMAEAMLQTSRLVTQSIEVMMATEKRVQVVETKQTALEEKVNSMVQSQKTAELELFDIPLSSERPKEITLRAQCRALLNKYCRATGVSQEHAWNKLYSDLNYRYGILVKAYTLNKNETRLALAERKGFLDKIYILVSEMVRQNSQKH